MRERSSKQAQTREERQFTVSASHVMLNANCPKMGARFPLRLAKGEALPPPFDPPPPGLLSPLDPDAGKGAAPLPAPTQLQGAAASMNDPTPLSARADSGQDTLAAPVADTTPARRSAPWRGRKRVAEARSKFVAVRCTAAKHAAYSAAAERAGLSVSDYLRSLADGAPAPRAARRPTVEAEQLARLLGQIGKLGSNVNQLTHVAHAAGAMLTTRELRQIGDEVRDMRAAVMKALGRGD